MQSISVGYSVKCTRFSKADLNMMLLFSSISINVLSAFTELLDLGREM